MTRFLLIPILIQFGSLDAQILNLTIGKPLPKNAAEVTKRANLIKIEDVERFLITPIGDSGHRYSIYKSIKHQFLLGWVTNYNGVQEVFMVRGKTHWDYKEEKPLSLIKGACLKFDFKDNSYTITGSLSRNSPSEQDAAGNPLPVE